MGARTERCLRCKCHPCCCGIKNKGDLDMNNDRNERVSSNRGQSNSLDNRSSDCCHFPKHPKPKKILFECGRSIGEANFDLSETEIETFKLAKVALDTSCLCRPQIKLEFTTEIFAISNLNVQNFDITLFFDIVQVCNGNEEIIREFKYNKRWSLTSGTFNRIVIQEPITITQCIAHDCCDCTQYFVQVRTHPNTDLIGAQEVTVNQGNLASISVFAQGLCDDC